MRTTVFRVLLAALIVGVTADVVRAAIFPSAFSFANSAMNLVFLLPFRVAGCG